MHWVQLLMVIRLQLLGICLNCLMESEHLRFCKVVGWIPRNYLHYDQNLGYHHEASWRHGMDKKVTVLWVIFVISLDTTLLSGKHCY